MKFIDLNKQTPKDDVPIVVTDFKNYCCVKYYEASRLEHGGDGFTVLGCNPTYPYSDIEMNFEPTHFAYIDKNQ